MAIFFKLYTVMITFIFCGFLHPAIAAEESGPTLRPSRIPPSIEGQLTDYVKNLSAYLLDKELSDITLNSWLISVASKEYAIRQEFVITWSQKDCGSANSRKTTVVAPPKRVCAFITDDRGFGSQAEIIFSVNLTAGTKQGNVKVTRVRFHTDLGIGAWIELTSLRDLPDAISEHLDNEMAKSRDWQWVVERIHKEKKEAAGHLLKCAMGGNSTRLMIAAERGEIERIKKLIDSGADVNAKSLDCEFRIHGSAREDKTALMFAAENGHIEAVRLLIEHGADMAMKDTVRGSAWMYAAESGHLGVLHLLWNKGAGKIEKQWIISSLRLLCSRRRPDIVEFLASKVDNPAHLSHPLTCVIRNKDNASVRALLAQGAQIRADAILAAASNNDKELLEYFLERGASLDMRMNQIGVGVNEATPLMLAAQANNIVAATLLLEMGANVNAVNAHGWMPLDYAKYGRSRSPNNEASIKQWQPNITLLESKSLPTYEMN